MYSVLRVFLQRIPTSLRLTSEQIKNGKSLWLSKATSLSTTNAVFLDARGELVEQSKANSGSFSELEPKNLIKININEFEVAHTKIPYTEICAIPPTMSLVQHVNTSEILSELVKLGVSIHELDKTPVLRDSILKLTMEDNVKPLIMFFMSHNIPLECIGDIINKCPYNLQLSTYQTERFSAYMKSKNFTPEMIKKILMKSPHLLQKR